MSIADELEATIKIMSASGRGILAADESTPTIGKRFAAINVESTEEMRRAYREMLFTTTGIDQYLCGVILFEETLTQKTKEGKPFAALLSEQGILPGIKVDKGLINLPNTDEEKVTQGLDGLPERFATYKKQGARFAKWRVVFNITNDKPSWLAIETNAEMLARYASTCQAQGIVPIVEPEVLMDSDHSIERCAEVTENVLNVVFAALRRHQVILEAMILKPNMAISGKGCKTQANATTVAAETLKILRRCVPAAVPTINFLSGGQSDVEATENLQAINGSGVIQPWHLSYSYGRALQAPSLQAWAGKEENVKAAQQALFKRIKLNSAAVLGEYNSSMEKEAVTI